MRAAPPLLAALAAAALAAAALAAAADFPDMVAKSMAETPDLVLTGCRGVKDYSGRRLSKVDQATVTCRGYEGAKTMPHASRKGKAVFGPAKSAASERPKKTTCSITMEVLHLHRKGETVLDRKKTKAEGKAVHRVLEQDEAVPYVTLAYAEAEIDLTKDKGRAQFRPTAEVVRMSTLPEARNKLETVYVRNRRVDMGSCEYRNGQRNLAKRVVVGVKTQDHLTATMREVMRGHGISKVKFSYAPEGGKPGKAYSGCVEMKPGNELDLGPAAKTSDDYVLSVTFVDDECRRVDKGPNSRKLFGGLHKKVEETRNAYDAQSGHAKFDVRIMEKEGKNGAGTILELPTDEKRSVV